MSTVANTAVSTHTGNVYWSTENQNEMIDGVSAGKSLTFLQQYFQRYDSSGVLSAAGFSAFIKDGDDKSKAGKLSSDDCVQVSKKLNVGGQGYMVTYELKPNNQQPPQAVLTNMRAYQVTEKDELVDVTNRLSPGCCASVELVDVQSTVVKLTGELANVPLQAVQTSQYKRGPQDLETFPGKDCWNLWHTGKQGAVIGKSHLDLDDSIRVTNSDGSETYLHEWKGGTRAVINGRVVYGSYDVKGRSVHTVAFPANDGTRDLILCVQNSNGKWVPSGERLIYTAPPAGDLNPLHGRFISSLSAAGQVLQSQMAISGTLKGFQSVLATVPAPPPYSEKPTAEQIQKANAVFSKVPDLSLVTMDWLSGLHLLDLVAMLVDGQPPAHFTDEQKKAFADNKDAFVATVKLVIGNASVEELAHFQSRLGQALYLIANTASKAPLADAQNGTVNYAHLQNIVGGSSNPGFVQARKRLEGLGQLQSLVMSRVDSLQPSAEQRALLIGSWATGFLGRTASADDISTILQSIAQAFMPAAGEGWASASSIGIGAYKFLEDVVSSVSLLYGQVGGWMASMADNSVVKVFTLAELMYDARMALYQHFSTALSNPTDRNYFQNKFNAVFSDRRSHDDVLIRVLDTLHEALRSVSGTN